MDLFYSLGRHEVSAHLLWQSDDSSGLREGGNPVCKVVAAGGEHRAVRSETLTFHRHRNIAQRVSEALLVQTAQHMGGMPF